ncbi:MAG: hypothetical protein O7D34_02235 [Ignavibacteria bacterium]|nr:hypothetical protein [Ignavibacteria bacterium]
MAIETNDSIEKFGSQTSIDDGSTGTIANNAFSVLADINIFTNSDDAPYARFVLKLQFDATMPTVGTIALFARPLNIDGANEPPVPNASFLSIFLGSFPIDFSQAADTDFYTTISKAALPNFISSQTYEFYIQNVSTVQVIGVNWTLKITPYTYGPAA